MSGKTKKLQHFVPRFYLRAWAEKEQVYCLQGSEIRRVNIKNVGAENYFYKLQELSPEDIGFLREFIKDSPEGLRTSHEKLLRTLMIPHEAKRELEKTGLLTPEGTAVLDQAIVELNDDLHTSIEADFQWYLESMISGYLAFLKNPEQAAIFYHALSVQYARTNHIKRTRVVMDSKRFEMYTRIANPLTHIVATNVGSSLYAERETHSIQILENKTSIPFITGDQPLINVASGPKDTAPPARFDLYYPLSPRKAMVLLAPSSEFLPSEPSIISENFVHLCNLRIAAHSYRQVFSASKEPLESIRNELSAYMSCFPG